MTTTELTVQITPVDENVVITVSGQAGMLESESFTRELTRAVALRPKIAVLDLSRLELIASVCMGSLIALQKNLRVQGGIARIAAPTKPVRDSIMHSKMHAVLPIFDTVEEALAAAR